jgi:hypothetical protein
MRLPVIQGVIDRRILVNYRVEPEILAKLLPAAFRPRLIRGYGMAGICLIRLKKLRPKVFPWMAGIGSENAAHRIAVEWDSNGQPLDGVYITRRDTSSRLNSFLGGRVFPGEHRHARFQVRERNDEFAVSLQSDDGLVRVSLAGRLSNRLPESSVFESLREASGFFETGTRGYSATAKPGRYDGLELRCKNWAVTPLDVTELRSSFFDNSKRFPKGTVAFDCALLMRGIEHEWHSREDVCCEQPMEASA